METEEVNENRLAPQPSLMQGHLQDITTWQWLPWLLGVWTRHLHALADDKLWEQQTELGQRVFQERTFRDLWMMVPEAGKWIPIASHREAMTHLRPALTSLVTRAIWKYKQTNHAFSKLTNHLPARNGLSLPITHLLVTIAS